MKLSKYILMTSALLMGTAAFAEDFGDFGGFEDDASGNSGSGIEVSGTVSTDIRAYVDTDDSDKVDVEAKPAGNLTLGYSGNNSDLSLTLSMDADKIKNNPEDIIDELVLRGRLGDYFTVEAGKMKVVWGKGDKLHVLDNFNADDYSNFIIPDYIDRRVSTPMLRAVISLPVANFNVEGVYTPLLPTDRFATTGRWTPAQVTRLTTKLTGDAKEDVAQAFTRYTTATATAGTLNALNADYQAAQSAYEKAYTDMYAAALDSGIHSAAEGYAKQAAGAAWTSMTDEQKAAAIAQVLSANGTAIEAGVKAQLNEAKIIELLREKGFGYYLDNLKVSKGKYAAACTETGFTADNIADEVKAAGTIYMYMLENANALSADPTVIYPDLWTLKYGQFGGRATWTLGQIDMGISYYNGWYKQPSVNDEKMIPFINKYLAGETITEEDKFLAYDKKQTFGLEASTILWHFNLRGEFAYNLTDDVDGTDPWVHNNSIGWLGGFDIDLPFANANLNVQEIGTYVLKGEECDKNALDVDYGENGYSNNKIAANLTTSFMNDKIAPEVTVMYGIENKDLVVMPKLSYKADQNLTLAASGMIINCGDDHSEFKAWEKNSFACISAKYQF